MTSRTRHPRGSAVAAMLAAIAVTITSGCSGTPQLPPPEEPWNVLLITVDTLRPDALGWVAGTNATPALDALAGSGFAFPSAVSPVPLTLPAHTSMLSGRIPPRHGVRDNGQTVPGGVALLPEWFAEAGYATGAFVSGYPLQRFFGLDRGFEHYDDTMPDGPEGWVERRAPATTAAAATWLEGRREPWFAWVHYYDPHDPYEPPRIFWKPGPRGTYDGEVEWTDSEIGRLLDGIPADVRERTLVVFTSDHGEALGEHGEHTHGYYIYESTVRVPLVFQMPGRVPTGRSDQPVRLVDIAPTVLELTGLEPLPETDGVSLVPMLLGEDQPLPPTWIETQLPWRYFGWAPLQAVRVDDWKYIDAPRPEIYDLSTDPGEQQNLLNREADRAGWLREELVELAAASEGESAVVDDPEVVARLRALGYVGAGSTVGDAPDGLVDPKDRIAEREKLSAAETLLRHNQFDQALALFREVLAVEPDNRAAVLRSGVTLLKKGDLAGAIVYLQRAIVLDPERAEARNALADALTRSGRVEEGSRQWMEVVRLQPLRVEGWMNLGTTLRSLGRLRDGVDAYARAAVLEPDDPRIARVLAEAWLDVAVAELTTGDESAAREALDRALEVGSVGREAAATRSELAALL